MPSTVIVASTSRAKFARERAVEMHVRECGFRNAFPVNEHKIPDYGARVDPSMRYKSKWSARAPLCARRASAARNEHVTTPVRGQGGHRQRPMHRHESTV